MSNGFAEILPPEFFLNLAMAGQVGLINYIYEVEGADVELGLKQLTQLLEAKHPILRTTIIEAGSNNRVQLVSGREPPWIKAPAIQAYLEATMHERMYMGCPAAQYCLVLNDPAQESKTFFVISMHHTYCDAFSRYLLEKDMLHILQSPSAFAQEEPRPWFGDFVNHLHKLGRDKDLLDYWTRYVQGTNMANIYPPELYDPRPGEIDGELSATLPARPLNEGRTQPSSTLPAAQTQFILSAWSLALAKHSRFRDIVFGLCRHGRSHLSDPNVRRMVGPLVTATPFRVRLDQAGETAVDLASRVQREIFSTAKWEQGYVPGVYPSGDGAPWVQSLVNMKSELYAMPDGYKTDEAGAPITRLITRRDIQFYDMESSWAVILIVHQKQGTFRFKMYYRSTLLEHGNAEALFGDFQEYVRKLTAYEGWTVGELIDGHVDDAA